MPWEHCQSSFIDLDWVCNKHTGLVWLSWSFFCWERKAFGTSVSSFSTIFSFIPGTVSFSFFSISFLSQDHLIILLRKFILSRNLDHRIVAVFALTELLSRNLVPDKKDQVGVIHQLKYAIISPLRVRLHLYSSCLRLLHFYNSAQVCNHIPVVSFFSFPHSARLRKWLLTTSSSFCCINYFSIWILTLPKKIGASI